MNTKTLTRAEVAAILGCGEQHVSTLYKRKRLRGRKVGNVLQIDRASVEDYQRTRRPVGRPSRAQPSLQTPRLSQP